jgi:predicted butyrate kinase (DUF1464 family)
MRRVLGIDPGTVSIDVCGLEDGTVCLDRSIPTEEALADPQGLVALLRSAGAPDLVAGPSGYGLPLVQAHSATETELRLAFLAAPGEEGGIGGLRRLAAILGQSGLPVIYTPGVIHLDTVPIHRKLNRVDLGTADKVAVAALGIAEQSRRLGCPPSGTCFILLELGGAFTAAVAVHDGRIVDGLGGTSGGIGWRSSGALDGEVAYLAGTVTKSMLFEGGARFVAGVARWGETVAIDALVEGALKAVRSLQAAVPNPKEILISGRTLDAPGVRARLEPVLSVIAPVRRLQGFARTAKAAAQGAAILADGLVGGEWRDLVETMRIRSAGGTVLDYLVVVSPAAARRRLGLP